MVQIEQLAKAALNRDSLELRSLVQDFLRSQPNLVDLLPPQTDDEAVLAMSAAVRAFGPTD